MEGILKPFEIPEDDIKRVKHEVIITSDSTYKVVPVDK
jgi:hypothetical protein